MVETKKPTALAFVSPFEGARSYFLAGLSHFYKLDVYYSTNSRFRFKWQIFYAWAYARGARFFKYRVLQELLDVAGGYDAVFIHPNALTPFFGWFENQKEITEFVVNMKNKGKKIYWLDIGETQYHYTSSPLFWDNIDACLKGQVFKKEYEPIFFNRKQVNLFNGWDWMASETVMKENEKMDFEKYRRKILPVPFSPSITQAKDLDFSNVPKLYDISANTRSFGNGLLRYRLIQEMQKRLNKKYIYSFDYDDKGWATNFSGTRQLPVKLLTKLGKLGKLIFKVKYGKYGYPGPLYVHNLAYSRCYFGPACILLSFRAADCFGAGTVLISFSFNKFDYGLPMEDGVNYVSLGERDEMTDDNENIRPEFIPAILAKVEGILGDRPKQEEIIKNGKKIYEEYYSSPKQFVKKIFIDKTGGTL